MKTVLEICLGSSCFSRGNSLTLDRVEALLERLGLREQVVLKGKLCTGACADGPCLSIDGTPFNHIHPDAAEDLIRHNLPVAEGTP